MNRPHGETGPGPPRKTESGPDRVWHELGRRLLNRGARLLEEGQAQEAISYLERANELSSENAMIWINLGAAYLGNPVIATAEKQMRAIKAFEKALELNPAAPNVHYNLGLIFVDRGETELAVAAFRQALQTNPFDSDARHWLQKLQAEEEDERE